MPFTDQEYFEVIKKTK